MRTSPFDSQRNGVIFWYNDKEFYESLRGQFFKGKTLSPKQVAALKKLAVKYQA